MVTNVFSVDFTYHLEFRVVADIRLVTTLEPLTHYMVLCYSKFWDHSFPFILCNVICSRIYKTTFSMHSFTTHVMKKSWGKDESWDLKKTGKKSFAKMNCSASSHFWPFPFILFLVPVRKTKGINWWKSDTWDFYLFSTKSTFFVSSSVRT